eukprot:4325843-Pleurochrysis_carterae.AAC.1
MLLSTREGKKEKNEERARCVVCVAACAGERERKRTRRMGRAHGAFAWRTHLLAVGAVGAHRHDAVCKYAQ